MTTTRPTVRTMAHAFATISRENTTCSCSHSGRASRGRSSRRRWHLTDHRSQNIAAQWTKSGGGFDGRNVGPNERRPVDGRATEGRRGALQVVVLLRASAGDHGLRVKEGSPKPGVPMLPRAAMAAEKKGSISTDALRVACRACPAPPAILTCLRFGQAAGHGREHGGAAAAGEGAGARPRLRGRAAAGGRSWLRRHDTYADSGASLTRRRA